MQFVADRSNDIFNLGLEELLERKDRDRRLLLACILQLLLVVQDGRHLCVMVPILISRLAVVQINEHVGQVLVQSVLDIGRGT